MAEESSQPAVAIITYFLSKAGRNASIRVGGTGTSRQHTSGLITEADRRLFTTKASGRLTALVDRTPETPRGAPPIEFDHPQTFRQLVIILRALREQADRQTLEEASRIAEFGFEQPFQETQSRHSTPLLDEILEAIGPQHPVEIEFWQEIVDRVPTHEIKTALAKLRNIQATLTHPGTILYHLIQSRS